MSRDFGDAIWKCTFCRRPVTPQQFAAQTPVYVRIAYKYKLLYHGECVQPARVAAKLLK